MEKEKTLIEKLISNPVVQTMVIFISGSWIVLEMTDYFIDHYDLVDRIRDVLLIVLLGGLPIALTTAWYISKRKTAADKLSRQQETSTGERTEGKSRRIPRYPCFTFPFMVLILLVGFVVIRSGHLVLLFLQLKIR